MEKLQHSWNQNCSWGGTKESDELLNFFNREHRSLLQIYCKSIDILYVELKYNSMVYKFYCV